MPNSTLVDRTVHLSLHEARMLLLAAELFQGMSLALDAAIEAVQHELAKHDGSPRP